MAEEATGVKEEQTPAAVGSPDQQIPPENVPHTRFNEVNTKLNQVTEQLAASDKTKQELMDQIALYQANANLRGGVGQPAAPAAQDQLTPDSLYDGLEDGDVLTVEESKGITTKLFEAFGSELMRLQFLVTHTDYTELCGTPEKPGKWIREAALKNPAILAEIQSSPNRMLTAYNHAKAARDTHEALGRATGGGKKPEELSPAAQLLVDASKTPGSPAGVGTGTGGISKAQYYSAMSSDELLKIADEVEGRV